MKFNANKKDEKSIDDNIKGKPEKKDKKDKKNKGNSKNPKEKNNKNKEKTEKKFEIEEKITQKMSSHQQEKPMDKNIIPQLKPNLETEESSAKTIKIAEKAIPENQMKNNEISGVLKEIQENKTTDNNQEEEKAIAEETKQNEINEDEIEEELERQRIKEEENVSNENQLNLDKTEWNCLIGVPLPEGKSEIIIKLK